MLFLLSLAVQAGLVAAQSSCNQVPYNQYAALSQYGPAQAYCAQVNSKTTTYTTSTRVFTSVSTIYTKTTAYNSAAPTKRDDGGMAMDYRDTPLSEFLERSQVGEQKCAIGDSMCFSFQAATAKDPAFVKALCSCLQAPQTVTSTVPASTTTTVFLSTASSCPSSAPLYCNGKCIPNSDTNCGACSKSCGFADDSGQQCQNGQCVYTGVCGHNNGAYPCGNTGNCHCYANTRGVGMCQDPRQNCTTDECDTDADCTDNRVCLSKSVSNCNPSRAGTCQAPAVDPSCYTAPSSSKRSGPARMVNIPMDWQKSQSLNELLDEHNTPESAFGFLDTPA